MKYTYIDFESNRPLSAGTYLNITHDDKINLEKTINSITQDNIDKLVKLPTITWANLIPIIDDITTYYSTNLKTALIISEIRLYINHIKFNHPTQAQPIQQPRPFKQRPPSRRPQPNSSSTKLCTDNTNTICIGDKNNILSNNYLRSLNISLDKRTTKTYKSVSNYVYSSFNDICILEKDRIETIDPKNALSKSLELAKKCIDTQKYYALKVAYTILINNNKELQESLLQTQNNRIIYMTEDKVLGNGNDGDGQNLVGIVLEQIRNSYNKIKHNENIEQYNDILYNIFKFKTFLEKKSLIEQIDDYLTYDSHTFSLETNDEYTIKTKQDFLEEYGRNPNKFLYIQEELDNKGSLFHNIRKNNILKLIQNINNKRNSIIFDMFLDYILANKIPNLDKNDYGVAKKIHFSDYNIRKNLEPRILKLFSIGMLSENLCIKIDNELEKYPVPTEQYINKIQEENFAYKQKKVSDLTIIKPNTKQTTDIIIRDSDITEYYKFSPRVHINMIMIENLNYPCVLHYMYMSMFKEIPTYEIIRSPIKFRLPTIVIKNKEYRLKLYKDYMLKNDVYKTKKDIVHDDFLTIQEITNKYKTIYDNHFSNNIKYYASFALTEKFKDRECRDALERTDTKKIVNDDQDDEILGIGKEGKGENFTGLFLESLRDNIHNDKIITKEGIQRFDTSLLEDKFIKGWITMKLNDMCNIVNIIVNYTNKVNILANINLKSRFAEIYVLDIINKIYTPCTKTVFVLSYLLDSIIPQYFLNYIREIKGFKEVDKMIIQLIWKRVLMMVILLYDISVKKTHNKIAAMDEEEKRNYNQVNYKTNIINTMQNIIVSINTPIRCNQDTDKKCVILSIINILYNIKLFNDKNSYLLTYDKEYVKIAESILVSSIQKIKHKEHKEPEEPEEPEEDLVDDKDTDIYDENDENEEIDFELEDELLGFGKPEDLMNITNQLFKFNIEDSRKYIFAGYIDDISDEILNMITILPDIQKNIIINRINFFSSIN